MMLPVERQSAKTVEKVIQNKMLETESGNILVKYQNAHHGQSEYFDI